MKFSVVKTVTVVTTYEQEVEADSVQDAVAAVSLADRKARVGHMHYREWEGFGVPKRILTRVYTHKGSI